MKGMVTIACHCLLCQSQCLYYRLGPKDLRRNWMLKGTSIALRLISIEIEMFDFGVFSAKHSYFMATTIQNFYFDFS